MFVRALITAFLLVVTPAGMAVSGRSGRQSNGDVTGTMLADQHVLLVVVTDSSGCWWVDGWGVRLRDRRADLERVYARAIGWGGVAGCIVWGGPALLARLT